MDPVKKPRRSKVAVRADDAADTANTVEQLVASPSPVAPVAVVAAEAPAAAKPAPRCAVDLAAADELADEEAAMLLRQPEAPRGAALSVKLSHQLHTKLLRTARDEGVDLEGLVQELLAEGVTLRAWEIIERKSAMRGQAPNPPQQQGPNGNRSFNNNNGYGQRQGNNRPNGNAPMNGNRGPARSGAGGRPPVANNAWMEDKAAFLEYVRNQEKRRR